MEIIIAHHFVLTPPDACLTNSSHRVNLVLSPSQQPSSRLLQPCLSSFRPWSGLLRPPSSSPEMAPITDDKVDQLRTQYHALEERIHRLEQRLETGEAKPSVAESMRLILIGPPGAGPSPATTTGEKTRLLIHLVQEREHKLQRSKTSTASAIWCVLMPRSLSGPMLILAAVGYGRHATSTSCQKDSPRKRSQEDHGSRWSGQ